jgi:hypothetical protein
MNLLSPFIKALVPAMNTAASTVFTGGIHQDKPPAGTLPATPYLVFSVISTPRELKYGGVQRATARVQFSGYGNVYANVDAAMTQLTTALEDTVFQMTTGHNVNAQQIAEVVPRKEEVTDANGNDVWQFTVDYLYTLAP